MFASLMKARRFAPLFWCQFLSALNDNLVRNALVILILYKIGSAHGATLVGYACYNATAPDFFGPTAVDPSYRGRGIGRALLLSCLRAMRAEGYVYAIVGGVGPAAFYEKTVGASLIPDSDPGIYADFIGHLEKEASGNPDT